MTNQKLKMWQNYETQNVFCHSTTFYVSKKLWQLKNQILTNLKNSNWYKTNFLTKLNFWQNFKKSLFSKNNLTPRQQMRCSLDSDVLTGKLNIYIQLICSEEAPTSVFHPLFWLDGSGCDYLGLYRCLLEVYPGICGSCRYFSWQYSSLNQ